MKKDKIIWAPLSSKNFSKVTDAALEQHAESEHDSEDKIKLLKHQKIVKSYISPDTPFRGVLLYHGLDLKNMFCNFNIRRSKT